ncbi:MAG: cysteate synthase [Bacteroidales bacterium]|jgi:cysteate synthase|nr:cysteate synthase [Bacteroidales bacterium]MDD2824060.1 cysteate synthase [Bacteroidales bacterium]MDD3100251.1 cysteate synthase [Bacteroidales bacterium]MDD3639063.1 cysteate synthase [Bacteroidales bacterium]MDD3943622.1 cysteate synthase [Bacteroidales bacterium]
MSTAYVLQNFSTGRTFQDTGWLLSDPLDETPSLIRAVYKKKRLDCEDPDRGLYRFADWLPVNRILKGSAAPVTYRSRGLASYLGLENLYITFNGYWPEKGALMRTCSFKETEAFSVCAHIPEGEKRTMVVASAGNTARAFARVCSENGIPLLLFVPYDNLDTLWFDKPLDPCVQLLCSPPGSDYFDAIEMSNRFCEDAARYFAEGGAKNIARRDGMGTTVLSAATTIGRIPDYYFQAVGSGTGVIAAWEANKRLIEDGRFGDTLMRLIPSQNAPFLPIYEAWNNTGRVMHVMEASDARKKSASIRARVLSNRKPPYGIPGGLYDALVDTGGYMDYATNQELERAMALFEELEGIDIDPAAGVATASLVNNVKGGKVDRSSVVMLNITGGGEARFKKENEIFYLKPVEETSLLSA